MSAFGKYGVGGSVPGKYPGGPDESTVDLNAANVGTTLKTPDTAPEKTVPELKN